MKKKEIVKLLEFRKNSFESQYGIRYEHGSKVDDFIDPLKDLFPNLNDIEEELRVLEKEFNKLGKKRKEHQEYVVKHQEERDSINCTHPIIIQTYSGLGYYAHCALCEKEVHDIKNKVRLVHQDAYYEDDYDSYPFKKTTYLESKNEFDRFYDVLMKILNEYQDDDEIDFNSIFDESFNKYNFGKVEKDKPEEKKYRILIISGSNQIQINSEITLNRKVRFDEEMFKPFKEMDNFILYHVTSLRNMENYYLEYYQTEEELNNKLNEMTKKDMDLVVDFSKLFTFDVINGKIEIINTYLDLEKLFPNSKIYQIKSVQDEISLYDELKKMILEEKRKGKEKVK